MPEPRPERSLAAELLALQVLHAAQEHVQHPVRTLLACRDPAVDLVLEGESLGQAVQGLGGLRVHLVQVNRGDHLLAPSQLPTCRTIPATSQAYVLLGLYHPVSLATHGFHRPAVLALQLDPGTPGGHLGDVALVLRGQPELLADHVVGDHRVNRGLPEQVVDDPPLCTVSLRLEHQATSTWATKRP